jgi:hypothetical protein
MRGGAFFLASLLTACVPSVAPTGPQALRALIDAAADGRLPAGEYHGVSPGSEAASEAFVYVEEWLNVNGESVHDVRAHAPSREGDFRLTRSADGRHVYLIVSPRAGMKVVLLGWPDELRWERLGSVLVVETPREMADEENHPCRQAFVFRFTFP